MEVRPLHCFVLPFLVSSFEFCFLTLPHFFVLLFDLFWIGSTMALTSTVFFQASVFNSDLSNWNTAKVTDIMQSSTSTARLGASGPCFCHRMFSDIFFFFQFFFDFFPIFFGSFTLLPVFSGSGFKRTMCGGQWSRAFPSSWNDPTPSSSGTNGRYGCCDAGTYMASPELNPFVKANACQNCPSSAYNPKENARLNCVPTCAVTDGSAANTGSCVCGTSDCTASSGLFCLASVDKCAKVAACAVSDASAANDNACTCGTNDCTASTGLFCQLKYCATGPFGTNPLPNGDGSTGNLGTGLRKVVSDWISGGAAKNTVLVTYGPIEDWNVASVTSLKRVFYHKGSFNADLSKWNTAAVTTMYGSTSTALLCASVRCFCYRILSSHPSPFLRSSSS